MPGGVQPARTPGATAATLVPLASGPSGYPRGPRRDITQHGPRDSWRGAQRRARMKPETSNQAPEPSSNSPLRVALVEDQREIRDNWKRLIESFADFKCICTCASAEEALRLI